MGDWINKSVNAAILVLVSGLYLTPVAASDLGALSDALFEKFSVEVAEIEKKKGASAAAGELVVAKQWIVDGRLFLREGRIKKAATIAERLPGQIALVRLLVDIGQIMAETEEHARTNQALGQALAIAKGRYDRLLLNVQGRKATDALPPQGEVDK
ncbi:MAG: hypothetical protein QNJ97_17585 [Myxococcota bacterium]|nr:hypothetical protein [Myxococcota bacterium]